MWLRISSLLKGKVLVTSRCQNFSCSSVLASKDLIWHSKGKSASNTSVLVCGWAGSKQPHVAKYTDLFSNTFGLDSFGCILPMSDFMSYDQDAQDKLTRQFLTHVSERTDKDNVKLIVMSLSNNGATIYQHIVNQCTNEEPFSKKFSIAGAIFDSGPGPLSWPAYMVCAANLGSNKLVQRLLTPTVDNSKRLFRPICTPLLQFYIDRMDKEKTFSQTLSEARNVGKRFAKNWEKFAKVWDWPGDYMLRERASWPLLFLYSDGDKMMPSAFIERVYEEQKNFGTRSVQKYNFGNTNHVAHLREKPQEYEVQMSRFLKPILESTS